MILVTGAAGMIGSAFVWQLNEEGRSDLLLVDDLGDQQKWKNLVKRRFYDILPIEDALKRLACNSTDFELTAVIHLGACSSTTESDMDFLLRNNFAYSKSLFRACAARRIPFIYASSAATYGAGEQGFSDTLVEGLRPINPYGYSKSLFDQWAMQQVLSPPVWVGLKFFNVFGPNEYHKGGQASVVYHAFPQAQQGSIGLFKSYRPDFLDGEQRRDFIYLKDVTHAMSHILKCCFREVERMKATTHLHDHSESDTQAFFRKESLLTGVYNLGTGKARSFKDLAHAVYHALDPRAPKTLHWIDMPEHIKRHYQYYTQAEMERFRLSFGYDRPFMSLEDGVWDYVQNYLMNEDRYL